jgi:hypothetical protein
VQPSVYFADTISREEFHRRGIRPLRCIAVLNETNFGIALYLTLHEFVSFFGIIGLGIYSKILHIMLVPYFSKTCYT